MSVYYASSTLTPENMLIATLLPAAERRLSSMSTVDQA